MLLPKPTLQHLQSKKPLKVLSFQKSVELLGSTVMNNISLSYFGETLYSGSSVETRFLNHHFRELSYHDDRSKKTVQSLPFSGTYLDLIRHPERSSTFGILLGDSYFPLLQSHNYFYVYGHPRPCIFPKSELLSYWQLIGHDNDSLSLTTFVQNITSRSFLFCWIFSSGMFWDLEFSDELHLFSILNNSISISDIDEIRISLPSLIRAIMDDLLNIQFDSPVPLQMGKCLTAHIELHQNHTCLWNLLNFFDDRWYLVYGNWMFELTGLENIDELDNFSWVELYEDSAYEL